MDPGPLTIRQLVWMADGRAESQWAVASSILAAIWSANTMMKRPRIFDPSEFNPFVETQRVTRGTPITAANIGVLVSAVVGGGRQR